ncbi:MAG: ABC transporter ATP-binding protein [Spirochaetaceae bacterium]|nr:MAG: ABC transporter ATP-binding protein [Spirochaetaceae bacterium]
MGDLLSVHGLETRFRTREGIVHAVNGVSFQLKKGETLGIVGESGCGKSVSVLSMLRLIPTPPGKIVSGRVMYQGKDMLKMTDEEIRNVRGSKISMVFQDPMTSLNPVMKIGQQVSEPLVIHDGLGRREAYDRAAEILELVKIPNAKDRLNDYPHQFSGGMRQRVVIAMGLICNPHILIADEPTTALDVTIQAQIIELIKKIRDEFGMAIIWITHDLGVVAGLADRVVVMYGGLIIEEAPTKMLYDNPRHPYTIGLMESLPRTDKTRARRLTSIEGIPPVLMENPNYCPFAPRCKFVISRCRHERPQLSPIGEDGHQVACWVDPETGRENA